MHEHKRMNDFLQAAQQYDLSSDFINWLLYDGFVNAPASAHNHGAYEGGLYDHSFEVAAALIRFTKQMELEWLNPRSPWLVGIFHDLCKIDQYIKVTDKTGADHFEHTKGALLAGHGDKSVILLSQWMTLTEEEILCIRYHMGAYETKEWNMYDKSIKKYPNVLWTHTADMYASKILGI